MRLSLFLPSATVCGLLIGLASPALAQTQRSDIGEAAGVVSTMNGAIPLSGARLVVLDANQRERARSTSEGDGRFRLAGLPAGTYTLVASIEGFVTRRVSVTIVAGRSSRLDVDLAIASIATTVDVVASSATASGAQSASHGDTIASRALDQFMPGSVQGALRLSANVIDVPGGGFGIKGGRPTQMTVRMGAGLFTDPALGAGNMELPEDAIDSLSVLPNPYAAEYGRFSSGLVAIQTRRARDQWKVRVNGLLPSFRTARRRDYDPIGLGGLDPRIEIAGPLIKNRLF